MTDPTPTRAEVERFAVKYNGGLSWDICPDENGEYVSFTTYEALRERAEAAEAERDRQYDENVHRIAMQARAENERDAARRAEAAAWNDAIEAAAVAAEEWDTFGPTVRAIRAFRRAAPTEGEA